MKRAQKTLQYGFLIYLFIVLCMVLFKAFQYQHEKITLSQKISHYLDLSTSRIQHSLKEPLWSYEMPSIRLILDHEVDDQNITRIALYDTDGTLVGEASKGPSSNTIIRKAPITKNHQKIGSVTIHFHNNANGHFSEFFWRAGKEVAYLSAIVLVLLILIIYWNLSLQSAVETKTRELRDELQRRTKAERQLNITNQNLENTLSETRILYEKSQAANQAKDDFLAIISHELRTPLNAIIGFSDILSDTLADSKDKEYARIINSNAEDLFALICDVLHFSSSRKGKIPVEPRPFSLTLLADELRGQYSLRSKESQVDFSIQVGEAIPDPLIGDDLKLKQILINLIDNAFKFTSEGSIRLTLDPCERSTSKDLSFHLRAEVTDTGDGIASDKLDHVFEPFTQEDQSNTRSHGGLGLGLSIVKNLTEALSGSIKCKSKKGSGTTFILRLPLSLPSQPNGSGPSSNGPHRKALPPLSVLVIEDNESNSRLIREILIPPVRLDLLSDGKDAVKAFAHNPCDVVLVDLHLPDLSGFEIIQSIRTHEKENPGRPPCKIIVLSADARTTSRDEALKLGADTFISKPFTSSQLISALPKATS